MPVTIQILRSNTPGDSPLSLKPGEMALNLVDKKLFYGNAAEVPVPLTQGVYVQTAGSIPPSPIPGAFWFQTDTERLKVYDGGSWIDALPLDQEITDVKAYVDEQIDQLKTDLQGLWPVGAILFTEKTGNPSTWMTFGTWTRISEGRFIAGAGTGTDSNGIEATGVIGDANAGYYEVKLTAANLPEHTHDYTVRAKDNNGRPAPTVENFRVGDTGNAAYFNFLTSEKAGKADPTAVPTTPPAYGLYVWKRTA